MPKLKFQYVTGPSGPESLVEFLTRRFAYHTGGEWRELVIDGHVTVNGRRVPPRLRLRTRDKIIYERPPFPEPEVDRRFRVLFEDGLILAVEKSGNLPTSPAGKYWDHCLVHIVRDEMGLSKLHACHRLDRETSGVNLLAKTPEMARLLGEAFQAGQVRKDYAAILRGYLPTRQAYCAVPLHRDLDSAVRIKQAPRVDGREARTRFRLLSRLPQSSLVAVETLTGRTHQIRAHAAWLGFPVWGDKLYGQSDAAFVQSVSRPRQAEEPRQLLHATGLTFAHPGHGGIVTVRSPARQLMRLLLASLNSTTTKPVP